MPCALMMLTAGHPTDFLSAAQLLSKTWLSAFASQPAAHELLISTAV